MSGKRALFDDGCDKEDDTLYINKTYAAKYEEWRSSEELQKLKDRYGEDATLSSDSESSSDGEFVEPDNPEFDRDFLLTLGALQKKDKKVLEGKNKFFTGDYSIKKKKEEKPLTIRDYQREIILKRGELEDENDSAAQNPKKSKSQDQAIDFSLDGDASSDDDGDGLLSSGLFKVKKESSQESPAKKETSETGNEVIEYLKGTSSTISNADEKVLSVLKDRWNDPKTPAADKWLADFFLNKRYLEDEDASIERAYNEVVIDEERLSDDEETLKRMETFETKYRFRFEEPDPEFIKAHPRVIPDSVRAPDERRKLHREALKQRKMQEKELKRQEIEKLKALKYKEISDKIEKIKEVSGNKDIDLGEKDLDGDFDPAAHDQTMSQMFDDDYYEEGDWSTEKPVFSDDEDIIKDYDDWLEKQEPGTAGGGAAPEDCGEQECGDGDGGDNDENTEWAADGNFNMDADFDANEDLQREMVDASRKKKVRRKSKFAKAIGRKKPVFDPADKNFEAFFDEYYQLDCEDIIGNTPCRFKYRKVESNNYGLTTEEILAAQDRELNKWFSLKKMLRYDRSRQQELQDCKMYSHRASLSHVKLKILPSLFVESPEDLQVAEQEKKRQKNLKKKLRRQQRQLGMVEETSDGPSSVLVNETNSEVTPASTELPHVVLPKEKVNAGQAEGLLTDCRTVPPTPPAMAEEIIENGDKTLHEDRPKKKKKKKGANQVSDQSKAETQETTKKKKKKNGTNKVSTESKTENQETPKKKKKKKKGANQVSEESEAASLETVTEKDVELPLSTTLDGSNNKKRPLTDPVASPKKKKKKVDEEKELNETVSAEEGLKKKKKKKKKKKEGQDQKPPLPEQTEGKSKKTKPKKKTDKNSKTKSVKAERASFAEGLSNERLLAYGTNPKKLKRQIIFTKQDF